MDRPEWTEDDAVEIATPAAMRELGSRLADVLGAGDLVVLSGPLGAGKTVLVQGIAAGLGVRSPVTSPTFVIARVHDDGRVPLVHVDAYRLGGVAEVDDLDLDADLDASVTVVEWGAGLVERLASEHLLVEIERPTGDDDGQVRRVRLTGVGETWTRRLGDQSHRAGLYGANGHRANLHDANLHSASSRPGAS